MKEKQHRLLSPSDSMYTCEDKTKLYFNLKTNKGERDETEEERNRGKDTNRHFRSTLLYMREKL